MLDSIVIISITTVAPTGSPSNVDTTVARNLTSITVQWGEVPCEDRNGEITGYIVEYVNSTQSTFHRSGTITVSGADNRTTVISGLLPNTMYTISVRAQGAPGLAFASGNHSTTHPTGL